MKKNFKTTGIVIRKTNLNEADRIVSILTYDLGKIDVFAKNARQLKSKFCGRLELFNEVNVELFEGKELFYLREVESIRAIQPSKDNQIHKTLFYIAEITGRLLQPQQQIEGVYPLLREVLYHLEKGAHPDKITYVYLVNLLSKIGFLADFSHCADCNEKLDLSQKNYLNKEELHLKCNYCASEQDEALTPSMIKWIHYMQSQELSKSLQVGGTEDQHKQFWQLITRALQHIISQPIKAEGFYR